MPVFLRLKETESSIPFKATDTTCITEAKTYEFSRVYKPAHSTGGIAETLCTHFDLSAPESIVLSLGNESTSDTTLLIHALIERKFAIGNVTMSACELRDEHLEDVFESSLPLKIRQDNRSAFHVHGWSTVSFAQGYRILKSSERTRILQFRDGSQSLTVIEVQQSASDSLMLKSLLDLVNLLLDANRESSYFPYRDTLITKLLWSSLNCSSSVLNVHLICTLEAQDPATFLLLELGDRLQHLMASTSMPYALRPRVRGIGCNLKQETKKFVELAVKLKQLHADANAVEYTQSESAKRERVAAQEMHRKIQLRTLEAKLASLEFERHRKVEMLAFKRQKQSELQVAVPPASHQSRLRTELDSTRAILERLQQEVQANRRALAEAHRLTPEERRRGSIRQAEFNLQVLKAQCRAVNK